MKKLILLLTLLLTFNLIAEAKTVRVALNPNTKRERIKIEDSTIFINLSNNKSYKISDTGTFTAKKLSSGEVRVGNIKSKKGVKIISRGYITINKKKYEGNILILPTKHRTIDVVEEIDLEKYLYGVLPYEMSASWKLEALKSQAVTARTYTLATMRDNRKINFDVYADTRSQVYGSSVNPANKVKRAVDETKGEVLTYKDKTFYTYYHGNCGGETSSPPWMKDTPKVLQGAKCRYDRHSPNYQWSRTFNNTEINKALKNLKVKGKIKDLRISDKDKSGRTTSLKIQTTNTTKYVSCNNFRIAIGAVN
ncbi:MAG: SpoIID/LytB domain-containing protein [Elusimicrobiaceae bacterium]|nr:SpoIID/LytB domain-containing protein [Elusimicrobiaceae bacterium]